MTPKVLFLKGPDFNVIDEVVDLMDENPVACCDLPSCVQSVANKLPQIITGSAFGTFRGPSGAIYPVYVTEDEPYAVYALLNRDAAPRIQVLKVGMRSGQRPATFFAALRTEVQRRVVCQGWSYEA